MADESASGVSRRARYALLSSLGITFPVSIVLGGAIGYYLDQKLGTLPWLSAVFLTIGIAAAFVTLFRTLRRFEELEVEDRGSKDPKPP
jgi:ATP synthase protein I